MLEDIKKEMNNFLEDVNQNIKDKEDLNYIKQRTAKLKNALLIEIQKLLDYHEQRLNIIIKKQEEEDKKLQYLKEKIESIYADIYEEEESFAISCPYCNHEFDAEIDEDFNEIKCPECGNSIELDWNGKPDDEPHSGCGGNCSNCGNCEN